MPDTDRVLYPCLPREGGVGDPTIRVLSRSEAIPKEEQFLAQQSQRGTILSALYPVRAQAQNGTTGEPEFSLLGDKP